MQVRVARRIHILCSQEKSRFRINSRPKRANETWRVVVGTIREVERVVRVNSDDSPVCFLQFQEKPGDKDGSDAAIGQKCQ